MSQIQIIIADIDEDVAEDLDHQAQSLATHRLIESVPPNTLNQNVGIVHIHEAELQREIEAKKAIRVQEIVVQKTEISVNITRVKRDHGPQIV